MPATAQAKLPDPLKRKPQRLRDRHTAESDLHIERCIQDSEILALAHQIQTERYTAERALKRGDLVAVQDSLNRIGQLVEELVAAEKRDVGLNQQTGDILNIRQKEWGDEA
jgi:hypothetical protein